MPVINFHIKRIEANKEENLKKEPMKKVDVKSNFTISSIKREKDERIGDYLSVNFKFDVTYTPNVGSIKIEGELWYYSKNLDDVILKENKERIALKGNVSNEISTAVLQGSIVEAIVIAKKLRLPVPLKLPQVNIKHEKMEFKKAS